MWRSSYTYSMPQSGRCTLRVCSEFDVIVSRSQRDTYNATYICWGGGIFPQGLSCLSAIVAVPFGVGQESHNLVAAIRSMYIHSNLPRTHCSGMRRHPKAMSQPHEEYLRCARRLLGICWIPHIPLWAYELGMSICWN